MHVPYENSSIAIDNIRLVNCFPGTFYQCTTSMFRCSNGSCLQRDHVCDLTADCADGEDETGECGKSFYVFFFPLFLSYMSFILL